MSEASEDRQAEKMTQQGERLIIIETKLDGIANTLNQSLMHLKDTVDRNHRETTSDLEHVKANIKANSLAAEKLLDKKLDRVEMEAHAKEGNDRYAIVLAAIDKKADLSAFLLVQKIVFGGCALILVAVVMAVIALVVFKPEAHRSTAIQNTRVEQPVITPTTTTAPKPNGL